MRATLLPLLELFTLGVGAACWVLSDVGLVQWMPLPLLAWLVVSTQAWRTGGDRRASVATVATLWWMLVVCWLTASEFLTLFFGLLGSTGALALAFARSDSRGEGGD